MLGPAKPRRLDQPIAVSLEDLVPADNFYRHLEAKLDLGFVREWTRDLYADRGWPSIDPVVFFKLQLVMFFEGIRSERCSGPSTSTTSRRCGATTRPRPTRRRSASGRSRSPPSGYPGLPRPRSGTAYAGCGSAAWRTRTFRGC